jgi:hypothetical protein
MTTTCTAAVNAVRILDLSELDAVTGAGGRPPMKGTGTRAFSGTPVMDPDLGERCNEFTQDCRPTANNGAYVWAGDHWERPKAPR